MDKLCKYCSHLFSPQPSLGPSGWHTIDHYANVGAFIQSAKVCSLCKVIQEYWSLDNVRTSYPGTKEEKLMSLPLSFHSPENGFIDYGVSWRLILGSIRAPNPEYEVPFSVTIMACPEDGNISEGPLWNGQSSSIKEKFEIIKLWFDECTTHHPECTPQAHKYPTRLIDLGTEGTHFRLVDTRDGAFEKDKYATLSHCWGLIRPLTTTKDNVKLFSNSIPIKSIPPTFLGSIAIARLLGIRYIWIDSLCIVQDDLDDWRREAARMKDVYSGSCLTIAASDAENSTQGCFVGKKFKLGSDVQDRFRYTRLCVVPPNHDAGLVLRVLGGDVRGLGPRALSTRGWALQEKVLSNRILHCAQPEMQWTCRRKNKIESGLSYRIKELGGYSGNTMPAEATDSELHKLWREWMQDYSRRNVTVARDRLVALAGVVERYGERTGHRHVLACWEQTMIADLVWIRLGDFVEPSSLLPEVPSWSWLSRVRGADFFYWIHNSSMDDVERIWDSSRVVEASVTWTGQPMVSEVQSASLIIEGPVRKFKLVEQPRGLGNSIFPRLFKISGKEPDFRKPFSSWSCQAVFDLEEQKKNTDFTCILMQSASSSVKEGPYTLAEGFLLLLQVPSPKGDTYRRVGMAISSGWETKFTYAKTRRIRLI